MSGALLMDKPAFTKDQITNASDAARNLKDLRQKAKMTPQVILDNGNFDSVLLDYEQYERMYLHMQELEEKILEERLERLENDPTVAIPWRKVRRSKSE